MNMRSIRADGKAEKELFAAMRSRAEETSAAVSQDVERILRDVAQNGDAAVKRYTREFDKVETETLELDRRELELAALRLPDRLLLALENAAARIRDFHERQRTQSFFVTSPDGGLVGQRVRPLARVGIYVPGGTAAYPSSVLMNAIPAKVAGVGEIVMATPPFRERSEATDAILAAAYIAGVDRVFRMGGAQAVGALAFGTESVPAVDKITGPGNIYVATAKRQVFGRVDIDMIAGPSEICVIADDEADPVHAAADMLSQAEHDALASSVLLCLSEEFASRTAAELARQLAALPRKEIASASLRDYGALIVCGTLEQAAALANEIAPEHLELLCRDPMRWLGRIDNAGSVFLGAWSPEPFGDYYAGPNHTLPTGGTARFFSPLSVDSFVKKSGVIFGTRESLAAAASDIVTLAEAEGLSAHANSIRVRGLV